MPSSKITILHYAAPPTIGGVESTIAAHARLLADHGYDCQIVAGNGEQFDPRVPVHILPDTGSRSPSILAINNELALGKTTERFHTTVYDLTRQLAQQIPLDSGSVLIVHNALSLHKNLALTAALRDLYEQYRFRLIAWCHDFAWTDPQYRDQIYQGVPWSLLQAPWPNVDYVVVSDARRRELVGLWGERHTDARPVHVIPPGIDLGEFLGIQEKSAEWMAQLNLLEGAPLLLLPARLTRRKRVEYAIDIVRELGDLGTPAKLVITGPPGPHNPANAAYLDQLEQRTMGIKDSVVFLHKLGAVTREIMRDLYLISDALLFPSEREGFGIPLLEAGLTRLPVFCSDIEPFHEIAGDRVHYIPNDMPARAAAEMIARRLEQDSSYRLKRRVLEQFTWEHVFVERIEPLVR